MPNPHRNTPRLGFASDAWCWALLYLLTPVLGAADPLAHWRFEQVTAGRGEPRPAEVGQPLSAGGRRGGGGGQSFVVDSTGNGNLLQAAGGNSPNVFSDHVPADTAGGEPNTRSLAIKKGEYVVEFDRPLPYLDLQQSWTIDASLKCNLLGTEQVYLCKEGDKGQAAGDISLGFDNMLRQYFIEVTGADGEPRRIGAGEPVQAGQWYDAHARAEYDADSDQTTVTLQVKRSDAAGFDQPASMTFAGPAARRDAGRWVIGRGFPSGFPNSLAVLDGAIDEVKISGEGLPRVPGQNPLFTDAFTADPAALVVGDTLYLYVGHDTAGPGGWFNMPEWLCYSTKDMVNWASHGPVLKARDFQGANAGAAWAAEVVEHNGRFYYYVTLDRREGHFITVAEADNPLGPFTESRPGKPLVVDADTTDSHRANGDIDPTVLIDDDGTPWMAWGNGDCYFVKLDRNMVELDGPITKVPFRNYSEGPWLFKRGDLYYNIYAADAPGVQPEQMCYATAPAITGPWSYGGFVTGPAKHGFTIHPAVVEFNGQWLFFYHDGSYARNGEPGGDCRRSVCVERLEFNPDGSIRPITLTAAGVTGPPE